MRLAERVAVITGAGRGLGRAIALAFAKEGCGVAVAARTVSEIEHLATEIEIRGGKAIAVPTDVSIPTQVENFFHRVDEAFGKIDIMVNNAGVGTFGPLEDMTPEALRSMIDVNLLGTIYCAQQAVARMKQHGGGHVINVVSTAGKVGRANESGYNASKWGVEGFTESLKVEMKSRHIRVTSFCPGGINTSFWESDNAKVHQPNAEMFMDPNHVARILLEIALLPADMVVDDITIKRA